VSDREPNLMANVSGATPFADSILRTRLSWMRTSLAVIVTGFLLVRPGITNSEPPVLALLAGIISVIVIATALSRFTKMGQSKPSILTAQLPRVIAGGIIALAVIACIRLILVI